MRHSRTCTTPLLGGETQTKAGEGMQQRQTTDTTSHDRGAEHTCAEPHGAQEWVAPRPLACGCITSMSGHMCIHICEGVSQAGRLDAGLGSTAPSVAHEGERAACAGTPIHHACAVCQHATQHRTAYKSILVNGKAQ